MEEGGEEGGFGIRLSKRLNDGNKLLNGGGKEGEVDYKTKAGTAWSHSYLNQKPWHPLSYPNQRRKWIAEQTHAQKERRAEEVAREYAQEQEFFRQTSLISKKEKEKIEMMRAVSFMYVRPPGYNAESAKAAEIADEMRKEDNQEPTMEGTSTAMPPESVHPRDHLVEEKKKPRPKDVFGRPLPTEEEFEVLKNAPRLETGVAGRAKPFGIELRNVKCIRCGNFGHQSGDRECPLKDAIMPNEEQRLKRDDPLTAIMAQVDPSEPLKWELKQKPGMSPPRGGFNSDDPNQQIVAEDIFDEYGGFLSGGNIPDLLTNFSPSTIGKKAKKSKKRRDSPRRREPRVGENDSYSPLHDGDRRKKAEKMKEKEKKKKEQRLSKSSSFDDRHSKRSKGKHFYSSEDSDSDSDRHYRSKSRRKKHAYSIEDSKTDSYHRSENRRRKQHSYSSDESPTDKHGRRGTSRHKQSYEH